MWGGGSSDSSSAASSTSLSGQVADGYLNGAKVCWDSNLNLTCDSGEPATTTSGLGNYSLDIPSNALSQGQILVEADALTVDTDTGEVIGKPLVLTAPKGKHDFISPMSTLISYLQDSPGEDGLAASEAAVKQILNTAPGVDIYANFVKQGAESLTNSNDYKKLHQAGQMIVRAVQKFADEQSLDLGGVSALTQVQLAELQKEILRNMSTQISEIVNLSEEQINLNGTVDVDLSKNIVDRITPFVKPDTSTIPGSSGLTSLIDYGSGTKYFPVDQVLNAGGFSAGALSLYPDGKTVLNALTLSPDGYLLKHTDFPLLSMNIENSLFGLDDSGSVLSQLTDYSFSPDHEREMSNNIFNDKDVPTPSVIQDIGIHVLSGVEEPVVVGYDSVVDALGNTSYTPITMPVNFGPGDLSFEMNLSSIDSSVYGLYNKSALEKIKQVINNYKNGVAPGSTEQPISALEAVNNAGGSLALYTGIDDGSGKFVQVSILDAQNYYRGVPGLSIVTGADNDGSVIDAVKNYYSSHPDEVYHVSLTYNADGSAQGSDGADSIRVIDFSGSISNYADIIRYLPLDVLQSLESANLPTGSKAYIVSKPESTL